MYLEKKELIKLLTSTLPGKIAHDEIAPYRGTANQYKSSAKLSSVLILLYNNKQNELQTTLIRRSQYEGVHSGQVGFPGGKMENSDTSIIETALREANEEIGIEPSKIEILGRLTDVFIPVSNFIVSPIVGWADDPPIFKIDEREVAGIINLSIKDIHLTDITAHYSIELHNKTKIKAPCFIINEAVIWGATALMLNEFKHLLKAYKKSTM